MYKAKSLNNSVIIYLGIIIIGIIFFFIWREKMQKESTSVAMLANLIQEEFSEERIPINQNHGNFESLNTIVADRNVGKSENTYNTYVDFNSD